MSKGKYYKSKRRKKKGLQNVFSTPLLLALGGIALIAAALFAVWKSNQPTTAQVPVEVQGAPALKVDQEKIDYGDVPLNQTIRTSFLISNVGDQDLRFTGKPYVEVVEGC